MTLPKRAPRPRALPKLDMPKIRSEAYDRGINALVFENRPVDNIKDIYDPTKASIDGVYQQSKQLNAPDAPPTSGGFPGISHYPIRYVGDDGAKGTATLGRGTLLGALIDQVGAARCQEIAKNMGDRNFGQPDAYDIYPAIHPEGPDRHFNRNFYVIREDGPADNNGFANPGRDTIRYRKADEGMPGMTSHELNHLAVEYGGRAGDRNVHTSVRENSPLFWKNALRSDHDKGMPRSLHKMLSGAAEDYGFDFSPAEGEWGALSPEDMDHIFKNIDEHFWKNQEQLANGLDWKNQALFRSGYETIADLPKSINERDFFRQALTEDLTPFAPRGSTDRFSPEIYNPLQLLFRAARENMTSPGAALHDKMLYRLGAGAGVAAGLSQGEGQQ